MEQLGFQWTKFHEFANFFPQKSVQLIELPFKSDNNNGYFTGIPVYIYGPGSSVGIATDYGLDGSGSNPGGENILPPVQTGPGAHPASCKMGTGSFPRVKCGRGVLLTTHPLLVLRSRKSRATRLPTLWATPGL